MTPTDILGLPLNRVERRLRTATFDLTGLLIPANEQGADHLEPSHILLALARIRGGLAESELAERRISVDRLSEAIRAMPHVGGSTIIEAVQADTVSEQTAAVFAALRDHVARGDTVGERVLLGHTLRHLEQPVVELLRRVRVDTSSWAEELLMPPPTAPEPFLADGQLDTAVFSAGALRALSTLCREAGALGQERLSTPLLLQTLTVMPDGLVEQALHFLQHDVRAVRQRLFSVVGGGKRSPVDAPALDRPTIDPGLTLVLQRASAMATGRRSTVIGERDLVAAMLETPGSVAESFFRDVGVDVTRLLKFGQDYYQERDVEETPGAGAGIAVQDAAAYFRTRLLGQDHVVDRLLPHLRRIKLGLELGYRRDASPSAALLFCGPSGTGKTMTARVLAELIYGSEDDVLMFEMGQFNSRESINNFIGAPPGYVGFGEGMLTNGLRDNPRRVLLFDEVEKADSRVFDALLRLLDEGKISDPAGPVRDARESVIVLTSNIGERDLASRRAGGGEPAPPADPVVAEPAPTPGTMAAFFAGPTAGTAVEGPVLEAGPDVDPATERLASRAELRTLLQRFFRPEFLNRVDEVVMFERFRYEDLRAIAEAGLEQERAKARRVLEVDLRWDAGLADHLATQAMRWRPDESARGVNRMVTELVPPMLDAVFAARQVGRQLGALHIVVRGDQLAVEEVRRGS